MKSQIKTLKEENKHLKTRNSTYNYLHTSFKNENKKIRPMLKGSNSVNKLLSEHNGSLKNQVDRT